MKNHNPSAANLFFFLSFFIFFPHLPAPAKDTTNPSLAKQLRAPGPYTITTLSEEWRDKSRDRNVPVKIYYPAEARGPVPAIVFSHGLGGSREGYAYLGNHWASHGYISVHLQHIGSDDAVWRDAAPRERMQAMKKAANLAEYTARPADVSFAIDMLKTKNVDAGPLKNRIHLDRIGMAGHSFGAHTTLAIAGQVYPLPLGRTRSYRDPRVVAAIAMSPMPPKNPAHHDAAFREMDLPVMHMTGTLDTSIIQPDRTAEERLIPFEKSKGPGKYLINFIDGDHMIFSGRGRLAFDAPAAPAQDAAFHDLIRLSSTAFWDAHLKEEVSAKEYLSASGLGKTLGSAAVFKSK